MYSNITDDYIPIKEILLFVWQNKLIITIITMLFAIATIIYSLLLPELYTSNSFMIAKNPKSNMSQFSDMAALAGISLGSNGNIDPAEYLDQVLQDGSILEKVLVKKWLHNGDSLYLEQIWGLKPDTSLADWQYKFRKLKLDKIRKEKLIFLNKDRKTGILNLRTNFPSADLTYNINIFSIGLLDYYIRNTLKLQAKEKRLFIEERINEVKSDLADSENSLVLFKERNFSNSSPSFAIEEMRLSRKITMNQELFIQLQKQFEMAKIEEKNDQPLIEVVRQPEIPIERASPQRTKIVMLGTVIGSLLGIVLTFSMKWFRVNLLTSR